MAMCENDSIRQLLAGVQTQAAIGSRRSESLYSAHAYSILFLHKSWSVTSTRLRLGVEAEQSVETPHSTWVIHCCYFYTHEVV